MSAELTALSCYQELARRVPALEELNLVQPPRYMPTPGLRYWPSGGRMPGPILTYRRAQAWCDRVGNVSLSTLAGTPGLRTLDNA